MPVTRINNNQISDASAGNTFVGINAAVKLQSYSITATKIANNLTYGSDLTITGNLTVQGNTTTIDTTYTTIEDPILLLASNQTGSPSVDIGFVGQRGTSNNIAFVWDESAKEFITVYTTTGESNTVVSIASYADIHSGNANIGGNIVVNGTTSLVGNLIGAVNATGNITGGNLITPGLITATGTITSAANITGANLNTGGQVVATGNITGGNISTGGQISATGNITTSANIAAGNITTTGAITTTGNLNVGNLNATNRVFGATGYFTGNVDVLGNLNATIGVVYANSGIFYGNSVTGNNAAFAGVPGFTQLGSNVVMQFAGNVNSYSQINFENVNSGNRASTDYIATADNGNDTSNYVNMGIASSTYNYPDFGGYGPNDAYLHNDGGNLILNPETAGKVIKFMVGGTGNANVVATMSSTGFNVTGTASASGNVTGGNLITGGLVTATGNVTGGNLITGGLITATGNVNTSAGVLATGNISGGNLLTGGLISATGNITSAANIAGGNLSVTNAINTATLSATGNLFVGGNLTVQGNITYQNVDDLRVEDPVIIMGTGPNGAPLTADDGMDRGIYMEYYKSGALGNAFVGWDNSTGNMIAATSVNFSANNVINVLAYGTFQTGNIFAQTSSATGNVTGGNLLTGGQVSATGNITTAANIAAGNISITGTFAAASLSASGNITGGNLLTGGLISATGNITSAANVAGGNVIATTTVSAPSHIGTIVSVTGNVTGGNIVTGGLITATGNITSTANVAGGNVIATTTVSAPSHIGTIVSVTGNVTGGNINTAGLVSATGNVIGGNISTGGLITATGNVNTSAGVLATGNVTGGNIVTGGLITATGNINGGNINTTSVVGTVVSMSGNITGANLNTGGSNGLTLNGSNINSNAGRITINSNDSDVDFAVDGSSAGNVFYVDAGTRTASFGSSTQTTNAIVAFNSSNSILLPVGNTTQRPATGVQGMLRFNSTLDAVEVYDSDSWTTVGTPTFTVITDDQFTGNGSQTVFNLSNAYTTNAVIVSINGVIQIPTLAYSVTSNVLTFTEAPQSSDIIDVRGVTTTTQVTSISNSPGTAIVQPNATLAQVDITGNLLPTGNLTQTLGSPTKYWSSLYVGGNTIYLGNLQLKEASANTFAVFTSDGTTQANIDVGNIDVSSIVSGTSTIGITAPNGNAYISVGGTPNVLVTATTGVFVAGVASASGNVIGANINTAGLVSATGNINGSNLNITGGIFDTGALELNSGSNGNIILSPNGTGVIVANKDIRNGQANGVGNIGAVGGFFNTIFAKATSAQYADLAENYCADAEYAPGTVLSFGGENEVTVSGVEGDRRIAGVVSTNPSYIMNSTLECEYVATVALTGRVPTLVSGPVIKGDMMVSAGNGRAMACATPTIGTVIGKALENHAGGDGVIEVVVGRL